MCFAVIFFSSTRNGSTVLAPPLYDDRENPFGPVQVKHNLMQSFVYMSL